MKERRNAKKKEGREKFFATGDVTRMAVSGSRTSEIQAELLSADVDDRRDTKDPAFAGSDSEGNGCVYPKRSTHRWITKLVLIRKGKDPRTRPPLEMIITPG